VGHPVRVDNVEVTFVITSSVGERCALFPGRHWIHAGDVIGWAWWSRGQRHFLLGWLCADCLANLPEEAMNERPAA